METVTFENDIQPVFQQYQEQMMWRLDLTSYENVSENAELIYSRISSSDAPMPPPPFDPLPADFVKKFETWMTGGCPQ